jgi:hypothetical protein
MDARVLCVIATPGPQGREAAVDAIVSGDLAALEALLDAAPELARARSCFPHQTTLLHHVAANGIESTRQWQSPPNAPDIAGALGRREVVELLLSRSPDLDVKQPVYGGSAIGMAAYPHPSAGRPNGNPNIVEMLRRERR